MLLMIMMRWCCWSNDALMLLGHCCYWFCWCCWCCWWSSFYGPPVMLIGVRAHLNGIAWLSEFCTVVQRLVFLFPHWQHQRVWGDSRAVFEAPAEACWEASRAEWCFGQSNVLCESADTSHDGLCCTAILHCTLSDDLCPMQIYLKRQLCCS